MATRTVRLDDEAEEALEQIRRATGLPISEALKRGLHVLQAQVGNASKRSPYDIYRELDPAAVGAAIAPARAVRRGVREALRKKYGR